MEGKLIKYKGNPNFICLLYKVKEEYVCIYGKTDYLKLEHTEITEDCYGRVGWEDVLIGRSTKGYRAQVTINFINDNNKLFTTIGLNKEADFDIVYSVLESVYGND